MTAIRRLPLGTMSTMPQAPQKYANETVWYTFYNDAEKREYYYEPKTKTARWINRPKTTAAPEQRQQQQRCVVVTPDRSSIKRKDRLVESETENSPGRITDKRKQERIKNETDEEYRFIPEIGYSDDACVRVTRISDLYRSFVLFLTSPRVATVMLVLNILLSATLLHSTYDVVVTLNTQCVATPTTSLLEARCNVKLNDEAMHGLLTLAESEVECGNNAIGNEWPEGNTQWIDSG